MKVTFVLPPLFFNKDSTGFNEMLACELAAVCKEKSVNYTYIFEKPEQKADIFILPVQYREDVFSQWMTDCVDLCHRLNGIVFVCGKSASVEYRYVLKYAKADFVLLGEAEETLSEILKIGTKNGVLSKNIFEDIIGMAYEVDGAIKYRLRKIENSSMDSLPFPDYSYLKQKDKYRICIMESSRSCHGKCNFCEGYLFRNFSGGKEYRVKSAERVVAEMKDVIDKYSCRVFSFSDDNFFADGKFGRKRSEEIAKLLIDKRVKCRFTIECRADDIDYETFKLLKHAGLIKVFVGIESGSQFVLDRYNKGTTVQDNHNAIRILKKLNIQCHPGHILFDPKTTEKELWETVNFFEEYLDFLFSFDEGESNRLLYYPCNCTIVNDFWPNCSEEEYEQIWYHGINCTFENKQTEKIYSLFLQYMKQKELYENYNVLQRRILCLKKALLEVRNCR